jgi:AbrB family looped-hinge helix DNA binding protein
MRINKDGRVTIPARLRKELDIRPGDRVRFKAVAGGIKLIVYARRRRWSVHLLITKTTPANTRAIA